VDRSVQTIHEPTPAALATATVSDQLSLQIVARDLLASLRAALTGSGPHEELRPG